MQTEPISTTSTVPAGNARSARLDDVALQFEELLVRQLTQSLANTTGAGDDSGDGTDSPDATTSLLASSLPDTLAQTITADGGLGLASSIVGDLPGATK
jgi:Rod binding domain-containing protein